MNTALLATIAAAGSVGLYVAGTPEELELYNSGMITVNPEDEQDGKVRATITEAGQSAVNAANAETTKPAVGFSGGGAFGSGNAFGAAATSGAVTSAATPAASTGPIRGALSIASVAKPKITRKGSASAYDFASLKAPSEMNGSYDAFFIADTATKPAVKVAKNAISNAKVEFRTEAGEKPSTLRKGKMEKIYTYDREFTVYTNDGPNGEKGAWVARTK